MIESGVVFTFSGGRIDGISCPGCIHCPQVKELRIKSVYLPRFEDHYAVTTNGLVWSFERGIWLKSDGQHPYSYVLLSRDNEQQHIVVHKLVAGTFPEYVPGWDGSLIDWNMYSIDHHDKRKKHNCVGNLRLVKKGQVKLGYQKGERNSKLREHAAAIRLQKGKCSAAALALLHKVSVASIYNIWNGVTHTDM